MSWAWSSSTPREVARVPRDVGDQETGRLSCHRRTPWEPRPTCEKCDWLGDASVLLTRVKAAARVVGGSDLRAPRLRAPASAIYLACAQSHRGEIAPHPSADRSHRALPRRSTEWDATLSTDDAVKHALVDGARLIVQRGPRTSGSAMKATEIPRFHRVRCRDDLTAGPPTSLPVRSRNSYQLIWMTREAPSMVGPLAGDQPGRASRHRLLPEFVLSRGCRTVGHREPVSVIRPPAVRKVASTRGRWSGLPGCRRVLFVRRRLVDAGRFRWRWRRRPFRSADHYLGPNHGSLIRQGLRHLLNPVADSEGSVPRDEADKGTKCPGNLFPALA